MFMPVKWTLEENNLVNCLVSEKLGKTEYDHIQSEIETIIKKSGNIRLLVLLVNFTGWASASGWEDTSFQDRNDQYINKFAIVGEEKWRDLVTVFTLQGLRPVPIEYFVDEQTARSWLDAP
jgi:hypothetical protein